MRTIPPPPLPKRLVEYKIITANDSRDVTRTVNTLLSDGWKLQDGLHVSSASISHIFSQVMVRYE